MQISVVYSFLVLKVELSLIMSCGPLFKASLFFLPMKWNLRIGSTINRFWPLGGVENWGYYLNFTALLIGSQLVIGKIMTASVKSTSFCHQI